GPAPLQGAAQLVNDDLDGMSFAEVVRSLQLRLDLPELELFTVEESGRVLVRVGGRPMAIEAQAARPTPAPALPVVAPPSAPVPATPAAAASHAASQQPPAPPPAAAPRPSAAPLRPA